MSTLNSRLAVASIIYHRTPTVENAINYRNASNMIMRKGGTPIVWPWEVEAQTAEVMAVWLAKPESCADTTVTIKISGNKLVSVLNTLQGCLARSERYDQENELFHVVESIRDTLSTQRCAARR